MSAVPSTRCRGSFRGVMLETSVIRSFISWKLASNSESRYFVIVSSTVHIACSIESISTSSPCKVNDSCSSSARGSRTCSGKLLVIVELKTTQVITLYSNNIATFRPVFPRHQQAWQDQESSEAHLV